MAGATSDSLLFLFYALQMSSSCTGWAVHWQGYHDKGMFYVAPQQGKLASLVIDLTTLRFFESRDAQAAAYVHDLLHTGRQRTTATVRSAPTHHVRHNGEDFDVIEDSAEVEISLREGPCSRISVPARLLELAIFAR